MAGDPRDGLRWLEFHRLGGTGAQPDRDKLKGPGDGSSRQTGGCGLSSLALLKAKQNTTMWQPMLVLGSHQGIRDMQFFRLCGSGSLV